MKRIISILVALLLAVNLATVTMAQETAENPGQLRYIGMASGSATLASSGNTLQLAANIVPWDGYYGKITIDLQERNGYSGTWCVKDTYSASGSYNKNCVLYQEVTGTPGHSYRGYCKFETFNSSGNLVDQKYGYTTILYL